ncbi:unnamed protein product [Closterium sp. NIES-54]
MPLPPSVRCALVAALLLHLSLYCSLAQHSPSPPTTAGRQLAATKQKPQAPGGLSSASLVLLSNNPLGAKCLDGSPPGYYFRPGFGAGKRFWHIFLPAGGWCTTLADCALRATRPLGSTRYWARLNGSAPPSAFVPTPPTPPATTPSRPPFLFPTPSSPSSSFDDSDDSQVSPATALNRSCHPVRPHSPHTLTPDFHLRHPCGRQRYDRPVVLQAACFLPGSPLLPPPPVPCPADLLAVRGLASARRVLVAGASAGGQAVTAWCERVAAMVPGAVTKCLVDSGVFLDAKDRTAAWHFRQVARQMTTLHRAQSNDKCMQAEGPSTQWRCFFPQYTLPHVSTPVFLLSPLLDHRALILGNQIRNDTSYAKQCISNILRSTANLTHAMGYSARRNAVAGKVKVCTPEETNAILVAGNTLIASVKAIVEEQPTWVAYIPASAAHCYTYFPSYSERLVAPPSSSPVMPPSLPAAPYRLAKSRPSRCPVAPQPPPRHAPPHPVASRGPACPRSLPPRLPRTHRRALQPCLLRAWRLAWRHTLLPRLLRALPPRLLRACLLTCCCACLLWLLPHLTSRLPRTYYSAQSSRLTRTYCRPSPSRPPRLPRARRCALPPRLVSHPAAAPAVAPAVTLAARLSSRAPREPGASLLAAPAAAPIARLPPCLPQRPVPRLPTAPTTPPAACQLTPQSLLPLPAATPAAACQDNVSLYAHMSSELPAPKRRTALAAEPPSEEREAHHAGQFAYLLPRCLHCCPPMYLTLHFPATCGPDRLVPAGDALLGMHPMSLTIDLFVTCLIEIETRLHTIASTTNAVLPPILEGCAPPQFPTRTTFATVAEPTANAEIAAVSAPYGRGRRRGSRGHGGGGGAGTSEGADNGSAGSRGVAAGGAGVRQ